MITDMTFLLILTAAVIVSITLTLRSVLHDAPSARPLSHRVDTDFVAPAERSSYGRAA
jgi:hypothetical protein